jgi:hypothetical protein
MASAAGVTDKWVTSNDGMSLFVDDPPLISPSSLGA